MQGKKKTENIRKYENISAWFFSTVWPARSFRQGYSSANRSTATIHPVSPAILSSRYWSFPESMRLSAPRRTALSIRFWRADCWETAFWRYNFCGGLPVPARRLSRSWWDSAVLVWHWTTRQLDLGSTLFCFEWRLPRNLSYRPKLRWLCCLAIRIPVLLFCQVKPRY